MTSSPEPFTWRAEREGWNTTEERRAVLQQMVDEWNAQNPEMATPFGKQNIARAAALFPHAVAADSDQMWLRRFTVEPEQVWKMIGDVVRFVSSEEVPRGQRRSSLRRVQEKDYNLEAVWRITGLVKPPPSTEIFPVAARELIGKRSLRDFARAAGFGEHGGHRTLARYLSGEQALSMESMEAIARAGRVDPMYFMEYRAGWLARELFYAMLSNGNHSLHAVKQIRQNGDNPSNGNGNHRDPAAEARRNGL